jgi:hypothetical protein
MRHASGRPVLAAAIFISVLIVGEQRASACDCVGLPTSEYLRSADVVYTGRVVSIRADAQQYAWPEIEFGLEHVLKGRTDRKRFVLVTPPRKGVDCRGFDFVVGQEYLVFATRRDSETGRAGTYGVNWCAGTMSLEADQGKRRLRETLQLIR